MQEKKELEIYVTGCFFSLVAGSIVGFFAHELLFETLHNYFYIFMFLYFYASYVAMKKIIDIECKYFRGKYHIPSDEYEIREANRQEWAAFTIGTFLSGCLIWII